MRTMTIAPEIEADRELLSLVLGANQILDRQMGPSARDVSASWKEGEWGAPTVLLLELEDSQGPSKATARFTLDELKDPRRMTDRLLHLWGDLLQDRSHRQLMEMLSSEPARNDSSDDVLDMISEQLYRFSERHGQEPHLLKLPIRYAVALMKLGPTFWGDRFTKIRDSGVRAFEDGPLFGVPVKLVTGVGAELEVE